MTSTAHRTPLISLIEKRAQVARILYWRDRTGSARQLRIFINEDIKPEDIANGE
jgi:hypothetical protein